MTLGLHTLRLRGFRRYDDETFTFAPGVNFLEGENNAGKTTVLYAIEYALFGRVGLLQPAGLLRTGAKAVGVEIVFDGRDGRRYRLQRIHVRPPRSRTTLHGHFTLKAAEPGEEAERYLLSSDFDDREDQLADLLVRALGVSRRGWELAVHAKQGTITDLLDGSPQLDIVLGVTSAVFVEDELRAMALERNKAAEELPVVVEALTRLDGERGQRRARLDGLEAEQAAAAARAAEIDHRRTELEAREQALAPMQKASGALDRASSARDAATHERDRTTRARAALGAREGLERDRDTHQAQVAALTRRRDEDRSTLTGLRAAARELDRQRADVVGRLERRKAQQGAAICDHCGQSVDPAHLAREVPELESALAAIDGRITVAEQAVVAAEQAADTHQDELTAATVAARDAVQALERLTEAEAEEATATDGLVAAEVALEAALAAGRVYVGEPATELRRTLDQTREALRTDQIRLDVDRQHVDEHGDRLAADLQDGATELQRLDREHAEATERHQRLVRQAGEATRLRTLAKAFKAVQQDLREQATAAMAERALALHRHLSGGDELEAVTIDPARYTVMVTPRDMGLSVPASTHQGGGHRLLLGLALRLALAEQIGPVPFVLLDEPTYGLDAARREALLSRISSLGVAEQLLVITHHEVTTDAHRLRVVRDGATSRVQKPPVQEITP